MKKITLIVIHCQSIKDFHNKIQITIVELSKISVMGALWTKPRNFRVKIEFMFGENKYIKKNHN